MGPLAWVCGSRVRPSRAPPLPAAPPEKHPDGLPFRYYFIGKYGALGYAELSTAEEGFPDAQFDPGFGLALERVASRRPAEDFGLTSKGVWVPMRDVGRAAPVLFAGVEIEQGKLDVAWVHGETARVYATPGGRPIPDDRLVQFQALQILETRATRGLRWLRIGQRRWVSGREVRAPSLAPPPLSLLPGERWIDVELKNQVLTAYEGSRAVFATLVSTGKGRPGTEFATPPGEFRIWAKLRSSDMDNLETRGVERYYAIQDVPWVMYFERGYGLHGTFWHHAFGTQRSHGCVNLSPRDAERLFTWTSPRLPAGWSAVLPTPYDRGTLVRIR